MGDLETMQQEVKNLRDRVMALEIGERTQEDRLTAQELGLKGHEGRAQVFDTKLDHLGEKLDNIGEKQEEGNGLIRTLADGFYKLRREHDIRMEHVRVQDRQAAKEQDRAMEDLRARRQVRLAWSVAIAGPIITATLFWVANVMKAASQLPGVK